MAWILRMPRSQLRIWVDLANAPQVLFFRPILRELQARGHTLVITGRRFVQTLELARLAGLATTPIGAGYERRRSPLVQRAYWWHRVLRLRRFARVGRFDVAASHGSSSQARAAAHVGLPAFVTLDYEFVELAAFRDAVRLMVPAALPLEPFTAAGIAPDALRRYPGLKEEVYLAGFRPRDGVRAALGVAEEAVLVTVRPASDTAHYLRARSGLEAALLARLLDRPGVEVLVLPRSAAQAERFARLGRVHPRLRVARVVMDGPSVVAASDLVLGGGGTMTREAAVLGVPAASYFEGRLGAIDRALVEAGRLVLLRRAADLDGLALSRCRIPLAIGPDRGLAGLLADGIVEGAACGDARRNGRRARAWPLVDALRRLPYHAEPRGRA
jgi:predicted glycosyltransferase